MVACRFRHIFVVDCRFASPIVDVDFHQKAIVDCRQKDQTSCDLHLIRTPPLPPPSRLYHIGNIASIQICFSHF